jgi:hypothetical protein
VWKEEGRLLVHRKIECNAEIDSIAIYFKKCEKNLLTGTIKIMISNPKH